jgi:hypothetical protein
VSTAGLHAVPDPAEPPPEELADDAALLVDVVDQEPDEAEQEAPAQRAFAMPDLRPYTDLTWVAEVINAGVAAARRAPAAARRARQDRKRRTARSDKTGEQPRPGRLLLQIAVEVAAGLGILLRGLGAWLGGRWGPAGMSNPARLGTLGVAGYFAYRAVEAAPAVTPLVLGAALVGGALRARVSTRKTPAAPQPAPAAPQPAKKRRGWLLRRPAPASAAVAEATPAEAAAGAAETAPVEPALTALIRSEIGAENGVHLADLRPAMRAAFPHLREASDGQLRQVLTEAGFDPTRKFRAWGRAGLAGVHRDDLPPAPSPGSGQGHSPGPLSAPGEPPRPGHSSEAESGGEGHGERAERQFDTFQDPEEGPHFWRIVHHGKD